MATITFDTHDFVKKLQGVGFSEEQAETLTDLQKTTSTNTLEQARHDGSPHKTMQVVIFIDF